jgi:hypothetical protein
MTTKRMVGMAACALALAGNVHAQNDAARLDELERQADVLAREIEKLKLQDVAIEPGDRAFGLSPSASKVYFKDHGVSLGGYGEASVPELRRQGQNRRMGFPAHGPVRGLQV